MTREKAIKIVKEFINGTCLHLVDQEALETLIPELKESEDERIRKEIIKFIQDYCNPCDQECDKWLVWLEQHKSKDDEEKYLDGIKRDWFNRGKKEVLTVPELYGLTKGVNINGEPINTETQQVDIPCTEWSEEDERMLSRCIKSVECSKQFADSETYKAAKDVEMNWLKSLSKRFNLQPKQEWSDEDEDTIDLMIAILRENHPNELFKTNPINTTCMSAIGTDMLIKRIEALRPQPKQEWGEKEIKDLVHILKVLDDCYVYGKHDLSKTDHDNLTSMIKSLRP